MRSGRWLARHPRTALALWYVLFAVMLEVLLRMLVPFLSKPRDQYLTPSRVPPGAMLNVLVHHDDIPNSVYLRNPSRFDSFQPVLNRINSFGIRGPEIRTKTLPRVLLIGDSFVEAAAVPFEATFGERLNRHFANRIEFLSHGVRGWSPTTEFSWIYHRGLRLDPDEVILFLCVNDFFRSHVSHLVDQTYRREAIWRHGVPIVYSLDEATPAAPSWRQRLKGIQLIRIPYYALVGLRLSISGPSQAPPPLVVEHQLFADSAQHWPQPVRQNVDSVIAVLLRLHDYLRTRHVGFTVSIMPLGLSWADEAVYVKRAREYNQRPDFVVSQAGLEAYVAGRMDAAGIPWLDPTPYFEATKRRSRLKLFNEADGHLNAAGHGVLADFLRHQLDSAPLHRHSRVVHERHG